MIPSVITSQSCRATLGCDWRGNLNEELKNLHYTFENCFKWETVKQSLDNTNNQPKIITDSLHTISNTSQNVNKRTVFTNCNTGLSELCLFQFYKNNKDVGTNICQENITRIIIVHHWHWLNCWYKPVWNCAFMCVCQILTKLSEYHRRNRDLLYQQTFSNPILFSFGEL